MSAISVSRYFNSRAAQYGYIAQANRWAVPTRLAIALRPYLDEKPPAHILDVGIGTGMLSELLKDRYPDCKITGLDVSPKMIETNRGKRHADFLVVADAVTRNLPINDDIFDLTVASGVSEFFLSPGELYSEMARVTRPGGILAFSYMPTEKLESHLFKDNMDIRDYCHPPGQIEANLAAVGMERLLHTEPFSGYFSRPPAIYAIIAGRKPAP